MLERKSEQNLESMVLDEAHNGENDRYRRDDAVWSFAGANIREKYNLKNRPNRRVFNVYYLFKRRLIFYETM